MWLCECEDILRKHYARNTAGHEKDRSERAGIKACESGKAMRYPKATRTDLTAPTGKFRVVAVVVDVDSADPYIVGDFGSVAAAEQAAMQRAGIGSPVYVYDEKAKLIVRYGSWH